MPLAAFEDFVYDACLRDWDAESQGMHRLLARFDAADEVRIVGEETDLRLSLAGRSGEADDGRVNLPGGEFFFAPIEDSAEGTIYLDVPPSSRRLRVRGSGYLPERPDPGGIGRAGRGRAPRRAGLDEGARFVGELGIGCNTAITQPMRNILFDEKMAGTIHLAIGASYPKVGGKNVSSLHWDLIKDLRGGGRIELDGEVVQENGTWRHLSRPRRARDLRARSRTATRTSRPDRTSWPHSESPPSRPSGTTRRRLAAIRPRPAPLHLGLRRAP